MNFLNNIFRGVGGAVSNVGKAAKGFFNQVNPVNIGQNLAQGAFNAFQPKSAYAAQGKGSFSIPQASSYIPSLIGSQGPKSAPGFGSAGVETTPAQKSGGFGKSLLDTIFGEDANKGQIGAGILSNFAGQAFAPKVNMPDIGGLQSVQNLRNFNNSSLPKGVEDSINRSVDIQHREELKRLQDVYRNARPGTDYTTDSTYQRDLAELERKQTLNRADAQANALLQFNQQEINHLSELAQQDIYTIMIKLGMDAQEAENFKQTFSNVGSMFLQSGLGLNQFKVA